MPSALLVLLTLTVSRLCSAAITLQDDVSRPDQLAAVEQPPVRICPLPYCEHVPTVAELRAPGVGFALEMGYGTATVRYHNGSYRDIVRVDGNDEYVSTMRQLAEGRKERMPYEYEPDMNDFEFGKAMLRRWWNKKLGRPATETTAVLAEMVQSLRVATEEVIGPLTSAAISSPDHIRLRYLEVNDVTEYLGIDNIMSSMDGLYATSAAYAGTGAGLCKDYIELYTCEREEATFHFQNVLQLDLSEQGFSGTIKIMTTPKDGLVQQSFIKPELGTRNLAAGEESQYWSDISTSIRDLIKAWKTSRHITYLILSGSAASESRFKSVVRSTMRDLVGSQNAVNALQELEGQGLDDEDLVWLTARGAAETAKRRQEGPVRCMDHEEGRKRRREQKPDAPGHDQGRLLVQQPT